MSLRITYAVATGQFERLLKQRYGNVAEACKLTMLEAGDTLKTRARASIAAAGFSKRWQNTLRVNVYPKRGNSVNSAVFLFHKIPYAHVFEDGAQITGKPLLWIPLSSTPRKIGRNTMNPTNFRQFVGALQSIRTPTGKPLLGAPVRLTKAAARRVNPKVSLAALRRGRSGDGVLRIVPLFVGVPSIRLRKRFGIAKVADGVRSLIPNIYISKIRTE